MRLSLVVFMLIFFKLQTLQAPGNINLWVVWDIGQGQWVTHILPATCIHYDIGGEPGTFSRVRASLIKFCGTKENRISLSHWDFDHYLNLPAVARTLPKVCWETLPRYEIYKKSAQKIIALKLPFCQTPVDLVQVTKWQPLTAHSTNDSSIVHLEQKVLLPGDSTIREEKVWSHDLKSIEQVKVLVLGHHGSGSSTGDVLLHHLPNLKFAVSSARYARYRHPNIFTRQRLQRSKIPLLRTEDWGSIWFEPL